MRLSLAAVLGYFIVAAFLLAGWVFNIIALLHMTAPPITGLFVARIVGIFVAPLGSVLGWFVS